MAFIVDIIILAIMLICIFLGYKKGLIGVAVNILGFFIALIIAFILYTPISNFIINNTSIETRLQDAISGNIASYVIKTNEEADEDSEEIEDNSPKVMTDYIDRFVEREKEKVEQKEQEMIDAVSKTVATNIIKVAVGILVFVVAKIALLFLKIVAKFISDLPIIGQFNKIGGIIYGVLQGLLIIYISLAIISLFAPTMENTAILEAINSSIIGKIMYNNNIILKIIF